MKRILIAAAAAASLAVPAGAATTFTAFLDEAQAGGTGSTATGSATLTLNDAEDALSIFLTVDGIDLADFSAGHLHNAPAGSNGGVVFGFKGPDNDENGDLVIAATATGFTVSTIWDGAEGNGTTLAEQLADLSAGNLYFNIHTPGFRSGEIRGQVNAVPLPAAGLLLAGALGALGFASRKRNAA